MGIAEGDLKVGDRVVYPNQGVCRVVGTADMEIGGHKESFIKLSREGDNATVMVPKGRLDKVGLRRIADSAELDKIFSYLASPVEGPELDWKVRHRTHGERMSEGGLMGLAQVVKGLTTLADLRPLPPKERELYDNARHLLVSEVAAAAQMGEVSAEDAVDLALFPPGVERKKPEIPLALGGDDGDDLGLDDVELGGDSMEGLDAEAAAEPEEEKAGEAAEVEVAEGEPPAEEAAAEGEGEGEAKKRGRKAEAKPEKPAKEEKAKAGKAPKPAAKPKAEKPKAKAAKPAAKAKAEQPKAKPIAKAKAAKPAKK